MSNHLAVASVTAALRELVYGAVSAAVPGAQVEYARPGVQPAAAGENPPSTWATLFLYGVTPNAAWRNADLPTRRGDGSVARRPQAALDLHYLISFYGSDATLEPQRMLGSVVRALHSHPVLTRTVVADAVAANGFLAGSDLEEAPEPVRFTPVQLNLEELSKLWSVLFQTPYALTVAYQGTVVLIEAEAQAPRPALPVRGRNAYVVQLLRPQVDAVEEAGGPGAPILPDGTLVLRGRALAGESTRVRIGGELYEPSLASAREVRIPLGLVPPARLRAGVQGVQVVHRRALGTPPVPHRGEESNVAAFVLRPVVRWRDDDPATGEFAARPLPPVAPEGPPRVEVRVRPDVGRRQRVELLLNDAADPERPAFLFPGDERGADGDTLVFDAPGLSAGRWLVRVRVDGAESVLQAEPPDPAHPEDAPYARPWMGVP